ncbi:MAG: glycosyltransferase family 2 protein [Thermomicrobiales bacterium]|nr:glycosyltransferase family 2 protein [Thermomicrobiales bacterium]
MQNQGPVQSEPSLSVVIPTYNESARIDGTIEAVLAYLDAQPYESELLIVNDGSTDDTSSRAHSWETRSSRIRVIDIPHAGKAAAVRRGVGAARNDLVVFTDADLATPITFLEPFRAAIAEGFDIVIGSREGAGADRIGEPQLRHVMGRVFNGIVRVLLLPGIQDTQCGFKMFTKQAARDLFRSSRLYAGEAETTGARVTAFDVELLVIARRRRYAIKVIPVKWTFGENSKVSPVNDTVTNLTDVLKVKLNDLRGLYD